MIQYPYFLQLKQHQEPTINEYGQLIGGTSFWIDVCPCRDELGGGKKIKKIDGQLFDCSGVVFFPKTEVEIKEGMLIRVIDNKGNVRLEKEVVRFSNDFFHCRIFV